MVKCHRNSLPCYLKPSDQAKETSGNNILKLSEYSLVCGNEPWTLIIAWPKTLNFAGTKGYNLMFWKCYCATTRTGGPNDDQGPHRAGQID
jgi:hypothetical protein